MSDKAGFLPVSLCFTQALFLDLTNMEKIRGRCDNAGLLPTLDRVENGPGTRVYRQPGSICHKKPESSINMSSVCVEDVKCTIKVLIVRSAGVSNYPYADN